MHLFILLVLVFFVGFCVVKLVKYLSLEDSNIERVDDYRLKYLQWSWFIFTAWSVCALISFFHLAFIYVSGPLSLGFLRNYFLEGIYFSAVAGVLFAPSYRIFVELERYAYRTKSGVSSELTPAEQALKEKLDEEEKRAQAEKEEEERIEREKAEREKEEEEKAKEKQREEMLVARHEMAVKTIAEARVPESFKEPIYEVIMNRPDDAENYSFSHEISDMARVLPSVSSIVQYSKDGKRWGDRIAEVGGLDEEVIDGKKYRAHQGILNPHDHFNSFCDSYSLWDLLDIRYNLVLPEELRTEHMHVVAGSGQGKSELIKSWVMNDLDKDCSIVVIDSQSDLINQLAPNVPLDRLVLVDPQHCPPALNLFAELASEQEISTALELYEYIFSALDTELTTKQQTAYRFVSRLLLQIPGANIHTMMEIFEPGTKHQEYVSQLGKTAQSFFVNAFNDKGEYGATRKQVLNRLYAVLENASLAKMLGSSGSTLNIKESVDSGKVILINADKNYLKQVGSSLFGRIFIAQVMQAVMSRAEGNRKKTYLYIDEFQDYAEDSHVLFNLFEQARKYNLGLIVAHQYLGQLPPKLQQSISANTAIKFAGGVSASDASILAKQMHTTPESILKIPKGTFAVYLRGHGKFDLSVQLGSVPKRPESELLNVRKVMRERYGVRYSDEKPELRQVAEPKPTVDKPGEW